MNSTYSLTGAFNADIRSETILLNVKLFYISASEHSLILKEINVPLWNHATCNGALQAQFGPAYTLPTSAICAGAEGRDACDVSNIFKGMAVDRTCRIFQKLEILTK